MPKYIPKALLKFQHPTPVSPLTPTVQTRSHPIWGRNSKGEHQHVQPLVTQHHQNQSRHCQNTPLLWSTVDPTLLTTLSSIAARQANGTTTVTKSCQQLLDYVATHPNASICYKTCSMILAVHTNASYLSKQEGKSRASAHFYLTNDGDKEFNNGAILTLSSIIKHVMSSASEAELAALYYGCKLAIPLRTILEEMGHPQHKHTMVTTNNIMAQGLTMGTMTPKASKSMDQRFHWLKCRDAQRQFLYLWYCNVNNQANYASKHHLAKHHQAVRIEKSLSVHAYK
jgi:hypothetical protein